MEYQSPHLDKFGELHAEPDVNENVTDRQTADRRFKEKLIDEPQSFQTIDFLELQEAGYNRQRPIAGDWGYLLYPPLKMAVPFSVVDDAIKQMTRSLQSAHTELEFDNGIRAREKSNAKKLFYTKALV